MSNVEEYEKQQEVSFDVADLFSFLWQKKFHIMLTVTILVSVGFYYVKKIPKTYLASSTLLLDDRSGGVNLTGLAALTGRGPSKMDTHIEFIRSKQFITSVVQSMDLHKEPEFIPEFGSSAGKPDLAHAVDVVIEDLSLSHLNETDMLKVSFVSKSPEIAARLVNQIGPMFFAFQSVKSRERAEIASRWLNSQVDAIQGTLTESETKLQQFLEENELVDLASQLGLVQSEISTLMREQLLNDKVVNEVKSVVNQANKVIDKPELLMGIPQIANSTVIIEMRKRIMEQERLLSEISKRYKHKHYRHITAVSQLKEIKLELANALQQAVESLKREYEVLLERKASLEASLVEAKKQHSKLGRLEITLTKLKRELESNQKLYEAFLSRLQETELLKDIEQQGNYAVIDYAAVPKRPFKPNVGLSLIVIVLLSTVFSTGVWLIVHLLSDKRSKVRQLLRSLDVPVLAEFPKLNKKQQNLSSETLFDDRKQYFAYSESVRSLRTVLLVNKSDEQDENRIIAVTRVSAEQKKSGLVVQLADSFSRLEKTLLIDADLRSPSIAKMFKLPNEKAGLTSLLSRRARLSECIYRPANTPLLVMTGGPVPADPLVYLAKQRFASFIEKLSIINERLVIDLPAINAYSDALVVSKLANAVVLECDIENIVVEELLMSVQRLQESGCPLMGVVLTNVKSKRKYK
ncbi:polysaccharide biosynthesis tyrosine autokinase [Aliiglaciecola litoralis]|uniref:Exopolysaccharide regulatory tyrosine autokinase VpsO n=1 Tax=Aliiglaciecola litoralis TaxID=582857 RepID=A0ABP3X6H5_9ALTE